MKHFIGLVVLLTTFVNFSQEVEETTNGKSIKVNQYYQLDADEANSSKSALRLVSDTIELNKKIGLDEKIDLVFKPIADFVGSIIFFPINAGSVNQNSSFEIPEELFEGGKDSIIIKFSDFKINASKDVEEVKLLSDFGRIAKDKNGELILIVKTAGTVKLAFSGTYVSVPLVLIILILGALFFTIYFKFVNFTLIRTAVKIVKGDYDDIDHHAADAAEGDSTPGGDVFETIAVEGAEGEVSHFQALTAALSATVGLGNIAGVAVAISLGGPGATFWMILAGFLGMATKFTECTLGVKYREVTEDGTVHGGPMYYLSKGLKEKGLGGLGKVLAIFFAIMCIGGSFGGGNMFQANQAAAQISGKLGFESGAAGVIIGIVMAIIVGIVIIGGIKRIGSVTEKVVPFMAVIYVGAALVILGMHYSSIPEAFGLIYDGAFNSSAALGGIVGVLIVGFQRAAFSNEAGVGSSAIAHSAVRTKYSASEGIVALLEPFIDTVIICTMTALVLIITNIDGGFIEYGNSDVQGIELTAQAFNSTIPYFDWVLMIAAVLFAISTMLSWSYYGLQAWKYLFGKTKIADTTYKVIFLFFVIVGASISLGAVIDFSDAMIFAMVFPNIIGLIILAPKVSKELSRYKAAIKKA
ncbi:MAG: alanine/glycine:cation symporter family protein [Crocinitomicaceae bacterium]|tara:strand:- start:4395 stop:6311 length:1917 start_codon:yes stop_codon:yes gene_type:complete